MLHIFLMQENGKLLWSKFLDIKDYSEGINLYECNNAKPIFLTDTSILFSIYFRLNRFVIKEAIYY